MSEPCAFEHCPLPRCCDQCETCLPHCGGCSSAVHSLVYFLRFWWSLGSWRPRQGGWCPMFPAPLWRVRRLFVRLGWRVLG